MNDKSFYVVLESDLILDNRINSTTKIVYAVISNYSNNKNGYCYLTYRQLAEITQLKKRQFFYCIDDLVKYNYLTKIKKGNRTYLMPTMNKVIATRKYKNENNNLFDYDWLKDL